MCANALGLPVSLEEIVRITNSEIGFAKFWKYLTARKFQVYVYSKIDWRAAAQGGFGAIAPWVADFMTERMENPDEYVKILRELFADPLFHFTHIAPTVKLLEQNFNAGFICEIMGDGWRMYGDEPDAQLLHRIFITNIDAENIYFHDPDTEESGTNYPAPKSDIARALETDGAELCCYKKC
jgi:hypothetical protein